MIGVGGPFKEDKVMLIDPLLWFLGWVLIGVSIATLIFTGPSLTSAIIIFTTILIIAVSLWGLGERLCFWLEAAARFFKEGR